MKQKVLQVSWKIAIVIGLIIFFALINDYIIANRKISFVMIPDSVRYAYQIEDLSTEGDELIIKGWFFELVNARNNEKFINEGNKFEVVLFDLNSEAEFDYDGNQIPYKGISTKVAIYDRQDVNNYFECEYDYMHCGFTARVNLSDVNIEKVDYQIVFKLDEENKYGIASNAYIHEGRLQFCSPIDYYEVNTYGTDLDKIVDDGICVACSKEKQLAIYQYGWKLYYITAEDTFLEDDGSTFIEYQLDTTQYNKLPPQRINENSYWDNKGETFEKNEITNEINCGDYRVSVRDIPTEYAVTRILTGYYVNNEWVWEKNIRPIYNFK